MNKKKFSFNEILQLLPHRNPFLLVDECYDIIPGQSGIGIKRYSTDEWFFQGHFPGRPIVPGVLIIETMAQVTAIVYVAEALIRIEKEDNTLHERKNIDFLANKVGYLLRADVKFLSPVVPPAVLEVDVSIEKKIMNLLRARVKARVGTKIVAVGFLDVSER